MLEASMLVIGDEILGGFVQDTNSGWIAQRLQAHGVPLTRVHTIPDELPAIDEALQMELARSRPRLIVTSGGIGSTPDDLTYEAVAASLGRDLEVEETIAQRIEGALGWTREQGVDVDDEFAWHMHRMSRIPAGGRLVLHEGWAPGVAVDVDGGLHEDGGATIVILPGVPSQLRRIFRQTVEPEMVEGRNPIPAVEEIVHSFPESALNLLFVEVMDRHPEVKLGSYPGVPMVVRLVGPGEAVTAAARQVRTFIRDLEESPEGARLASAWAERLGNSDKDRR